jgi:membrane fusion protein, multidrug efflux system
MFKKMIYKKKLITILFLFSFLVITSCMKEEKSGTKSMEEIHAEEGLPVNIKILEETKFDKQLSFFARLSGIKESEQATNFAEKVKRINARVGQNVRAGQVIVELSSDIPSLQYEQAKLAMENAEKTFNRMKALLESGETSQQNYDQTKMAYDVSKKNFESLEKMIKIESPFSGTLISLDVKEGEIPTQSSPGMPRPLFTVAQLDIIKATIQVNETEINNLRLGMPAKINYNREEFTGKISMISPALNPRTQAFEVEVNFQNGSRKLKSGVTTDLIINIYTNPNAIVVPINLIVSEHDKDYVFIEKNGIAQKKEIKLGYENGINVEVVEGLKTGDHLINCCKTQLKDGMKVNLVN